MFTEVYCECPVPETEESYLMLTVAAEVLKAKIIRFSQLSEKHPENVAAPYS